MSEIQKLKKVKIKMVKASSVRLNPDNPRKVSDEKMEQLVKSIIANPKMIFLREIIARKKDNVILGGNQRYSAIQTIRAKPNKERETLFVSMTSEQNVNIQFKSALHWLLFGNTIPVKFVDDLEMSELEEEEFLFTDNISVGDWDWGVIQTNWDFEFARSVGLDVPDYFVKPEMEELVGERKNKPAQITISFISVQQLELVRDPLEKMLIEKCPGAIFKVNAGEV